MADRSSLVIAVVNNKGGVGKTTTAVNLGAALASAGCRVLLVDLDSQGSASLWCGVHRGRLRPSSASCLLHEYPIEQTIRRTRTRNLELITGSVELASADVALCDVPGRELVLKELLEQVRDHYSFIILDCPPSLSLIGVNALVAADGLVVPVVPQFLAVEGLVSLMSAVEKVRIRLGAKHRLLGILVTMLNERRQGARELRERVRAQFRDRVFHTEIAVSRALEEAPGAGQSVLTFAPRSRAADAFRRLAGEVLERTRPRPSLIAAPLGVEESA